MEIEEYKNETFNFDELTDLTFGGENHYIFKDCIFRNCNIKLIAPEADFVTCVFMDEVNIHNQGTGDIDTVKINGIRAEEELASLTVRSSDVDLRMIKAKNPSITIESVTATLDEVSLCGSVSITVLHDLKLKQAILPNLQTLQILDPEDVEVEESVINGQKIEQLNNIQHLMDCVRNTTSRSK